MNDALRRSELFIQRPFSVEFRALSAEMECSNFMIIRLTLRRSFKTIYEYFYSSSFSPPSDSHHFIPLQLFLRITLLQHEWFALCMWCGCVQAAVMEIYVSDENFNRNGFWHTHSRSFLLGNSHSELMGIASSSLSFYCWSGFSEFRVFEKWGGTIFFSNSHDLHIELRRTQSTEFNLWEFLFILKSIRQVLCQSST